MKMVLTLVISLMSLLTFAETNQQILSNKIRPVAFQIEKTLTTAIKERLSDHYSNDKLGIEVKVVTDPDILAKKAGLNLTPAKFALPGLDESKDAGQQKIQTYQPVVGDVMGAITQMNVHIISGTNFTKEQKNDMQDLINSEISTLGILNIKYRFSLSKTFKTEPVPVKITDEKQSIDSKTDPAIPSADNQSNLKPLIIVIVSTGLLISLVMFFSLYYGFKKIEKMSQELSTGLSSISISTSTPTGLAPTKSISSQEHPIKNTAQDFDYGEAVAKKIQLSFKENPEFKDVYFRHVQDIQENSKMMIFIEAVDSNERQKFLNEMSADFKQNYNSFIKDYNNGPELQKELSLASKDMMSDLKLMPFDSTYLSTKAIKLKIHKVKRDNIQQFISSLNANEFSYVIPLLNPVMLAATLSKNPELIENFSDLTQQKLNSKELEKLSQKLDTITQQAAAASATFSFSTFLPPEIEARFNSKIGKSQTSWEELTDSQINELEAYAKSLSIQQLSSLLAISTESIRSTIISRLPDIRKRQLQRYGIKMTDESFMLKHDFFSQNQSGTVQ